MVPGFIHLGRNSIIHWPFPVTACQAGRCCIFHSASPKSPCQLLSSAPSLVDKRVQQFLQGRIRRIILPRHRSNRGVSERTHIPYSPRIIFRIPSRSKVHLLPTTTRNSPLCHASYHLNLVFAYRYTGPAGMQLVCICGLITGYVFVPRTNTSIGAIILPQLVNAQSGKQPTLGECSWSLRCLKKTLWQHPLDMRSTGTALLLFRNVTIFSANEHRQERTGHRDFMASTRKPASCRFVAQEKHMAGGSNVLNGGM